VDLALEDVRRQFLRHQHEVDRGGVHCILPRLGPAGQEALEDQSVHEVDDGFCLALSRRQDPVSSPQLVMPIEIAGDHNMKAWATAALRRAYHVVEQPHRPA
jgi:hypothetical protein